MYRLVNLEVIVLRILYPFSSNVVHNEGKRGFLGNAEI